MSNKPFFFVIRFFLFFVFVNPFAAIFADAPITIFEIDATQRGSDIASLIGVLTRRPYNANPSYEVAIQTASLNGVGIVSGIIPYVQSVTPATNETLLIVTYLPKPGNSIVQYIVVPVEQISLVLYAAASTNSGAPISQLTPFVSSFPSGVLPRLSISPIARAADIVNVFNLLLGKPYFAYQVDILTTLTGNFPPIGFPFTPSLTNGSIQNVIGIKNQNDFLLITYQPRLSNTVYTIVAAPEQVQQMVYYSPHNTSVGNPFP